MRKKLVFHSTFCVYSRHLPRSSYVVILFFFRYKIIEITTDVRERARVFALREEVVKINEMAARIRRGRATVISILAGSCC